MGQHRATESRTRHWDGVYSERGEQGVSWFAEEPAVSLKLLDVAGIRTDRSVIDVGAGASRLVDELLLRGHRDLTALDVSDHGLAIARTRLGAAADDVHWLVADLLSWRPRRRFAAWHDRAVFHFLADPDDRARYRAVLDDTLDADGVLVIATFAEDGPRACSGLPTVGYCADELLHELGGPGRWIELARHRDIHVTPTGIDQAFTWMALRRRPASAGVHDSATGPEHELGQLAGAATTER